MLLISPWKLFCSQDILFCSQDNLHLFFDHVEKTARLET